MYKLKLNFFHSVASGINYPMTEGKWVGSQSNKLWCLDLCYTLK